MDHSVLQVKILVDIIYFLNRIHNHDSLLQLKILLKVLINNLESPLQIESLKRIINHCIKEKIE